MSVLNSLSTPGGNSNEGGYYPKLYFERYSVLTASARKEVTPPKTYTVYANTAALNAATPSAGDYGEVTTPHGYFKYNGTVWVEIDEFTFADTITSPGPLKTLRITKDSGAVTVKGSSEFDCNGNEIETTIEVSGLKSEILDLQDALRRNDCCLWLANLNGDIEQLGQDNLPAVVMLEEAKSGGKATDARRVKLKISANRYGFVKGVQTLFV